MDRCAPDQAVPDGQSKCTREKNTSFARVIGREAQRVLPAGGQESRPWCRPRAAGACGCTPSLRVSRRRAPGTASATSLTLQAGRMQSQRSPAVSTLRNEATRWRQDPPCAGAKKVGLQRSSTTGVARDLLIAVESAGL